MMLAGAIGSAVSPTLAKLLSLSKYKFLFFSFSVFICFTMVSSLWVAIIYNSYEFIVPIIYTEEFLVDKKIVLIILLIGPLLAGSGLIDFSLITLRALNLRIIIAVISVVLILSFGMILIEERGLYGASLAVLISSLITLLLSLFFKVYTVKKVYNVAK
jgi:O-antigen/teichoic acid export membrane protein